MLGVIALVVCAFYFWTAYTSPAVTPGTGYYGLLTDALIDGQTHLPLEPHPQLLALPDPYDPATNTPYMVTDVSLFEGRYYLYFGPTPVVLVHLPLRAVGVVATDALAVALMCSIGFLFALALMRFLVQRYRPQTALTTQAIAALVLGIANVAPFLLRRPSVWEGAIAAGYLCVVAGLHLTLTGALRERPSALRLAGGSLALGLAVGARPHLILVLPLWLWAWRAAWRASRGSAHATLHLAGAALVPLGFCLMVLAAYNAVRFGSPTEFGATYQLGGVNSPLADRFDLARLAPGTFSYLLAPPRLGVVFPFVSLDPGLTGLIPPRFIVEPVAGLFATAPIALLALAAPVLLFRRPGPRREDMTLASLLLLVSALVIVVPTLSFNGGTERYVVDFATLVLLAALLVWLRIEDAVRDRAALRRVSRTVAALACAISVFAGLALSVKGYWDGLRVANPRTYAHLESAFDVVPSLASRLRGEPILLETRPAPGVPTPVTVLRLTAPGAGTAVVEATAVASAGLPPGSLVPADLRQQDGRIMRIRMTVGTPVRLAIHLEGGGPADIQIRWGVARAAGSAARVASGPAGVGLAEKHLVAWSPR